jgi:group I intron endonuclease
MSNIKSGIYQIINLTNGKVYIGSTCSLGDRKSRHLKELRNNTHHSIILQNAWNKHGEENFKFEILELVEDKSQLINREQFYFDTLIPTYNICKIAGSCLGIKHSPERIAKNILSRKNIVRKIRSREEVETSNLKLKATRQNDPSILLRNKQSKYKSVIQLDQQGNFIAKHPSLKQAAEITNIHISHINCACLNKYKIAGGFIWLHEANYSKQYVAKLIEQLNLPTSCCKAVLQFDLKGSLIKKFPSIKAASVELKISASRIINICKNKPKSRSSKGSKFQYQ